MNKTKQQHFKATYGNQALVTGGTSGIGEALAHELAQAGLDIVLVGRNTQKLDELAKQLPAKYHNKVTTITADLSTTAGVQHTIEQAKNHNIGFFAHLAGIESHGLFTDNPIEAELKLIELNIKSTLMLTHYFGQAMSAKQKGGILLVSSLTGHMPSPYFANYAASKSYILNLGFSLHAELSQQGVDVSVLSPGLTKTPMADGMAQDIDWSKTPMKFMEADTVAKEAFRQFGKKISIIPGGSNRAVAFVAKRIASPSFGKKMVKMMKKAIVK